MRMRRRVAPVDTLMFVEVPQAGMVITKTRGDEEKLLSEPESIRGAFVKIQPLLRRSERTGFDAQGVKSRLVAAGAAAVIVDPVVVPDSMADVAVPLENQTPMGPKEHLEAWFASVQTAKKLVSRALAEAMDSIDEASR